MWKIVWEIVETVGCGGAWTGLWSGNLPIVSSKGSGPWKPGGTIFYWMSIQLLNWRSSFSWISYICGCILSPAPKRCILFCTSVQLCPGFFLNPFSFISLRVDQIISLCSFDHMKNLEVSKSGTTGLGIKNNTFYRSGQVGDWKNYLTRLRGVSTSLANRPINTEA